MPSVVIRREEILGIVVLCLLESKGLPVLSILKVCGIFSSLSLSLSGVLGTLIAYDSTAKRT